ncbi:zinc finger CCCH domain-containing protein 17-like [Salvia splendens]|uniref:zinc finger CCCH domain-containing protein 17-like n=1 Tax=Salvia splendens TaxID=180675 RepID=UPI001C27219F|nr:zinc finger CCCH domain-containing protein 17-like [Salvia splendens]
MATSAPQSQSQSQPPSADEELLKRSTDCVYFLASPLTCKKGSECEYRHSDVARMNPRDCWYWLHGNCMNPKCAFRHPPLEGLLGTQGPSSAGPSAPVPQAVIGPASHGQNAFFNKPSAACVFFQKGHCLKGDWCPFLHAPTASNTKAIPVPVTGSSVDYANISKPSSGVEKPLQQKVTPINVAKSFNDTARVKPLPAVESTAPRYESAVSRKVPQTSGSNVFSRYRTATPVSNGHPGSWSNHAQQSHLLDEPESMYNKDAEEVSREPSPGFDVLVDDEGRNSEFYPGEDRYGMSREHEHGSEYEINRSADYNLIAANDDDIYLGCHGYDSLDHHKGRYAWEQHRASSERMSGGSYHERRPYGRQENHGQVDEHDLRHRLSKHKKPNGLRSVINHEHARDMHVRERNYWGSHREEQRNTSRENSHGSRLRGRIRLPEGSSSPNNRDMIRTTDRISSQPGRIRDRIKGRPEEASNGGAKNYRGPDLRRDFVGENNGDFAKPKSLAELKNQKNADSSRQDMTGQQSLGKRKYVSDWHQHSENDLAFEGPKPLLEILKRKKRETSGTIVGMNSSGAEGVTGEKVQEESEGATEEPITQIGNHKEVDKPMSIQTMEAGEGKPEAEDGELGEDPESEPYEQKDGESDYEQMGGEDYVMYEDGENGDAVEEYVDEEEEDDDEFAKKMGVMYS